MAPYPTKDEIEKLASALATEDASPFWQRVSPNVTWVILGTCAASGTFTSLESFQNGGQHIVGKVLSKHLKLKVTNAFGGGDRPWATIELDAVDAFGKDGTPYTQHYCWVTRFDQHGMIVLVREYADTQLFQQVFDKNS